MSWWKRKPPEETPAASESPAETPDDPLAEILLRIDKLGSPFGPSEAEALEALRAHSGTVHEPRLLGKLTAALQSLTGLDALRVALGRLLMTRGRPEQARQVLDPVNTIEALMMSAELDAEAGDLHSAIHRIERVLVQAIDTPGAKERHRDWMQQLGRVSAAPKAAVNAETTVVAAAPANELPFRLLREHARGGAGTIYEAEDLALGRRLAFKRYHDKTSDREQLRHEAATASALRGAGVVAVYDVDPDAGWIALEWVAGGSLAERIERTPEQLLPFERWLRPLVDSLARIHEKGWVHSDLKPSNILLRSLDEPLLTDFGAARTTGQDHQAGTVGYLAPERLDGEPAHPSHDVYALGIVIGQALTAAGAPERYQNLREACLAPRAARPADGKAVRQWLDAHASGEA